MEGNSGHWLFLVNLHLYLLNHTILEANGLIVLCEEVEVEEEVERPEAGIARIEWLWVVKFKIAFIDERQEDFEDVRMCLCHVELVRAGLLEAVLDDGPEVE